MDSSLDSATRMLLDGNQALHFLQQLLWLMLRIGALLMNLPMVGTHAVPKRVRIGLALGLAVALAPLVPPAPLFNGWQADTVLTIARELLLGTVMGFALRLLFEVTTLAGEWIAQGTGLAFAQMNDPLRGGNSGVIGQWFYLLFGLLFFAANGHLALITLLHGSYHALPIGTALPDLPALLQLAPSLGMEVFRGALGLALPVMVAMLAVNLGFGVLARAAPALNPMQLGLPVTVLLGLGLLALLAEDMAVPVQQVLDSAFLALGELS